MNNVTGHVLIRERKKGPMWYVKWRDASGHQQQKALGPAWLKRWRRPPAGFFTRRDAEAALQELLDNERRTYWRWFDHDGNHSASFADQARMWLEETRAA